MKSVFPLLLCLFLFSGAKLHADNDSFSQTTSLNDLTLPHYGYIAGAGSAEPGEPAHAGSPAARSYWYKWQATSSSPFMIREMLNASPVRIAVYTGSSLSTLVPVAQGMKELYFQATAEVIYHIAIDSTGADLVHFRTFPTGGADQRGNADAITGTLPLKVSGNNVLATTSNDDPTWHSPTAPVATVWWKWTAPSNGSIRLDARASGFHTRLTAYEYPPAANPIQVSAGFESVGVEVTAGNDYYFCVDGRESSYARGEITLWLEWIPTTPPSNDNLADARDLGSPLVACDGEWIRHATAEAGVPNETAQPWIPDRSLWWKWTCPASGTYRFSSLGSDGTSWIHVYTGPAPGLTYVAGMMDRNGVKVSATAGTTYWVQINSQFRTTTRAELNIHPAYSEPSYFVRFGDVGVFRLYGPQRHPDADPDGDGLSNQLEFALGTNPEINDPENPLRPSLVRNGAGWQLQWTEVESYTRSLSSSNPPGRPLTLTARTSLTLDGDWVTPT
ncbi:MAG: hypothetical protein EOP85_06855, partial [Verrucomicrobiaceae bacterium]